MRSRVPRLRCRNDRPQPSKPAIVACLLVVLFAPHMARGDNTDPLRFGVVPQQAAAKVAALWTPILAYLSADSAQPLRFETAPDIPAFELRLAAGEYDLAYMNPYHYTVFRDSAGYRAFAKQQGTLLRGIIVARSDASFTTISGLEGATLAFPSPAAFAATILTSAELRQHGVLFTARYVKSHDSVYRNVAAGLYTAGGGIEQTFANLDDSIQSQLKIVHVTNGYTPHAFAASARVDAQIVAQIQAAMIAMSEAAQGRKLLESIEFAAITTATDKDWDDVRALRINVLENPSDGN